MTRDIRMLAYLTAAWGAIVIAMGMLCSCAAGAAHDDFVAKAQASLFQAGGQVEGYSREIYHLNADGELDSVEMAQLVGRLRYIRLQMQECREEVKGYKDLRHQSEAVAFNVHGMKERRMRTIKKGLRVIWDNFIYLAVDIHEAVKATKNKKRSRV